ncbi:MAG: GNAT family N-acetyltransferase [Kiloniellales bacterium]|nr:GNAT family N-acetyltransferase [Kiloniellales bacterium]
MQDETTVVRAASTDSDRSWIEALSISTWGSTEIVVLRDGTASVLDMVQTPALLAWNGEARVGWLAYEARGDGWEVVSLVAAEPFKGIGSALLGALASRCRNQGSDRIRLVTTNDNLTALRFYQRRGFRLAALHKDALDAARRLKPSIPRIGRDSIPMRDMLELEAAPGDVLASTTAGDDHA